LKKYKNILMI